MRKAFISPTKYVQGEDEIRNLGYFVKTFGDTALLISHPDDRKRVKEKLKATEEKFGVTFIPGDFRGECSREEIQRLKELAQEHHCSCTVGLGGGKAVDTAKCVAEGVGMIAVPTIAATDASTSHSAVMYTQSGEFDDYAYFKASPSVVLVDTTCIANAPTRFLVSGMGDAMSTWFEARASANAYANVNAGLPCGVREGLCGSAKGTKAALALAKLCYETLLEDGVKAKIACDHNVVTPALENIVEANILLSGLGFESAGLAAAHAIHDGLSLLPGTHHSFHGEKVSFGTIAQLVLENAPTEELETVIRFNLEVGLPVCLGDIGVPEITDEELIRVAEKTCIPEESVYSMPFPVSVETVAAAIRGADEIGKAYKQRWQK